MLVLTSQTASLPGQTGLAVFASPYIGTLGADISHDGDDGDNWLRDNAGFSESAEYFFTVETPPTDGDFVLYHDGSFAFGGAADGTYTAVIRVYETDATGTYDRGTETLTLYVGESATTLSAAGTATASASGELTVNIALASAAFAQAVSDALLSSGITMTAAAVAQAAADGTLITAIRMLGSAQAQAGATGDLSTSAGGLDGNAQSSASASAILATQILLYGSAIAAASATGSLAGATADLAGAAVSTATGTGELAVNIALTAQALASAIEQGSLTTQVVLNADAAARAHAGAQLGGEGLLPIRPAVSANRFTGPVIGVLQ